MKLPVELMKIFISAIHFIYHYWRCRVNLRGFGGEAKSCMNDKFGLPLINFVKGNDYFEKLCFSNANLTKYVKKRLVLLRIIRGMMMKNIETRILDG